MKGSDVTLLWTGGWDSTFRLLQLLQDTDATVQPLYLVEDGRASTTREIDTMRKIRLRIEKHMPNASKRLLPTDYGSFRATAIEPHYKTARRQLQRRARIGLQYPVLASYAEQKDIRGIELSVEANTGVSSILSSIVEVYETDGGRVYVLPESIQGAERLFSRFYFPLLDYTKLEMKNEAEERGVMSIMKLTHFCFNPILGFPCGGCRPCQIARNEGMGERIGKLGPMLSFSRAALSRVSPESLRGHLLQIVRP